MSWPVYESHKVVWAARIVAVQRNHGGGRIVEKIWVRPDGPNHDSKPSEEFWPSVNEMAEKAEVGGYAVVYPDGFKSISPQKAFEEGYTRRN
jgi:hypothetical protein